MLSLQLYKRKQPQGYSLKCQLSLCPTGVIMLFNGLSWSFLFLDEEGNILNFALKCLIRDQDCSDMKVDQYSENCQVQLEPDIIL